MALRKHAPSTKIIGYQYAVTPQAFLNYFVGRAEVKHGLLPDKILTTGDRPKAIMRKYSCGPIEAQAACALRFEYLRALAAHVRRPIRHVLLALEGSFIVEPMVKFVFEQLAGVKGYTLRIRTHPLLPWDVLEKRLELKIKGFTNVEISNASLKADLEWGDVIVYYSTTVSMEALMMGKPVVHIDMNSVLNFDPLFECNALKASVRCDGSLRDALKALEAMPDEQFKMEQRQARAYLDAYFFPVTEENISRFIPDTHNTHILP
ncbi:MAG: hypothetical protein HY591_03825, partial [Candidatus Omnitrophica bacterium]|nr:hypothetical protein [Candidatus Omnitrophota bacterium]